MTIALAAPISASQTQEQTFSETVRPHVKRLYSIAYSILRDRSEAEDAVQETMVLAWKNWKSMRDSARAGAWLAKICVNHCLRHHKMLSARWRTMDKTAERAFSNMAVPFQGRMLDLDRAYLCLSKQQRAVVALTYHHGYTVEEAAGLMDCRPGTARSHLARALATLRKELGDD